jgi:hypothetical protein
MTPGNPAIVIIAVFCEMVICKEGIKMVSFGSQTRFTSKRKFIFCESSADDIENTAF